MKFSVLLTNALICLAPGLCHAAGDKPSQNFLWYKQPAVVQPAVLPWAQGESESGNLPGKASKDPWESQSLPVGNGRVGGTLFGGDKRERINLNEVSLWSGGPNLPGNGSGYHYGPTTGKDGFGSYQPFGNLYIDFQLKGETENYTRSLDLRDGIARVSFRNGGAEHTRECFVSEPDNLLVYMARSDSPEGLDARIALTPNHTTTYSKNKNGLVMSGTLANGERFEGQVYVKVKGGSVTTKGKGGQVAIREYRNPGKDNMFPVFDAGNIPWLEVKDAESVTIYVSLATDYKMDYASNWKGKAPSATNKKILADASKKSYSELKKSHTAHYKKLFNRLSLSLGKSPEHVASLPTDERIATYQHNGQDPELEATIYQYGRYVLISGSRPGNLPVNLQGIWNDKVHAAWACDYHNNINLQMCYWGAEVGNLSECHMPFINFMKAMEAPLTSMTSKHFGPTVKGWTTRISQNPWGGGGWTEWNPPVNAWYALHLWDHYTFTHDKTYLKNVGYPILKNICAFWESHLKEVGAGGAGLISEGKPLNVADYPELKKIKAGSLVSPNSWSHEWGPHEDGVMHDQQLIWELFDNTAKAAKVLGVDSTWAKKLISLRDRLVPCRVADGGYLQEWIIDRPNMVSGHRHTSHLIGVFPGSSISMTRTPELAQAAMRSLELRGCGGDNRRSWTWPWRTALWARFHNTSQAYEMVQNYIRYNVLDNLFGNHPPMQMDGTYGMTGGMSEMLLQSHAGQIELLPALPDAWSNGYVKGIRARGDITVDMEWEDGQVTNYKLRSSSNSEPVTVVVNGKKKKVTPEISAGSADKEKAPDSDTRKKKKKSKKKKKA
jgi:alpha-L-fucosidase 2